MIINRFKNGLLIGLALPIIFGAVFIGLDQLVVDKDTFTNHNSMWTGFGAQTSLLLAICVNLLPTVYANKQRKEEFIRGIMVPTIIFCFIWAFYYRNEIFNF